MNVQVDLLLPGERRSGRTVRGKFVAAVAGLTVPAVLLLLLAALIVSHRHAAQNRANAEQEKQQVDPEYRKVMRLQQDLRGTEALRDALAAWQAGRLDGYRLLRGLQRETPATVQYVQAILDETLGPTPAGYGRSGTLLLRGRVAGGRPDLDVQRLSDALRTNAYWRTVVETVAIKRFAASESPADAGVRLFDIECVLKPRALAPPASPAPAAGAPAP